MLLNIVCVCFPNDPLKHTWFRLLDINVVCTNKLGYQLSERLNENNVWIIVISVQLIPLNNFRCKRTATGSTDALLLVWFGLFCSLNLKKCDRKVRKKLIYTQFICSSCAGFCDVQGFFSLIFKNMRGLGIQESLLDTYTTYNIDFDRKCHFIDYINKNI